MNVQKIDLTNFTSYSARSFNFGGGVNVIHGDNAQGKTNLLDAVFMFCLGRSHRSRRDRDLISFGENAAKLELCFSGGGRDNVFNMSIFEAQKKQILLNGVKVKKASDLIGHFHCVLFCPDHLDVIKGAPQNRRDLMDTAISQLRPNYSVLLQTYNLLLKQKSKLLKSDDRQLVLSTLSLWNERLCDVCARIMVYRQTYMARLSRICAGVHGDITKKAERMEVLYRPNVDVGGSDNAAYIKKAVQAAFAANEQREREARIPLVGCHRDDFLIHINDKAASLYGSQGQQRTCVLSLKIAEAELVQQDTGEPPVMLLDDMMSELDHWRQDYLLGYMTGKQVMITCTSVSGFDIRRGTEVIEIVKEI